MARGGLALMLGLGAGVALLAYAGASKAAAPATRPSLSQATMPVQPSGEPLEMPEDLRGDYQTALGNPAAFGIDGLHELAMVLDQQGFPAEADEVQALAETLIVPGAPEDVLVGESERF